MWQYIVYSMCTHLWVFAHWSLAYQVGCTWMCQYTLVSVCVLSINVCACVIEKEKEKDRQKQAPTCCYKRWISTFITSHQVNRAFLRWLFDNPEPQLLHMERCTWRRNYCIRRVKVNRGSAAFTFQSNFQRTYTWMHLRMFQLTSALRFFILHWPCASIHQGARSMISNQ